MYLFPSGVGIVSIILFIIAFICSKMKKFKTTKKFIKMLMILILVYILVGCIVLFRPPFKETGDVYFSAKIDTKLLTDKINSVNSASDFVNMFVPVNEELRESLIEAENGQPEKRIYKYYNSKNSRVTITVVALDDKNLLREKYWNEIEYEKNLKYLVDNKGFCMYESDENEFCIFPVGFDGTKFLLPFADSGGANFYSYFYFGDSYVIISEFADNIYDLIIPKYLNTFMPHY